MVCNKLLLTLLWLFLCLPELRYMAVLPSKIQLKSGADHQRHPVASHLSKLWSHDGLLSEEPKKPLHIYSGKAISAVMTRLCQNAMLLLFTRAVSYSRILMRCRCFLHSLFRFLRATSSTFQRFIQRFRRRRRGQKNVRNIPFLLRDAKRERERNPYSIVETALLIEVFLSLFGISVICTLL